MKFLVAILFAVSTAAWSAIGNITEQSGPAVEITRQKSKLEGTKGTGVEMSDAISTARSKIGITFEDKTRVQVNEQSRLVIDEFVYDPKSGTGKLAANVALGTVRYASGAIAQNSKENVRLKTPTATVSVRGTDFTMTVDEIGRSLVILLPTCPEGSRSEADCVTGTIEVATDVGAVILNQAFQATMVNSASQPPSSPKLLNLNESQIDNLLIISPPRELGSSTRVQQETEQKTALDTDLLEYKQLSKNFLETDLLKFSDLDINRLDVDYLDDILSITGRELDVDELATDPVLPTVRRYPWIQYAYNEESIIIQSERPPHIAYVKTERHTDGMINLSQNGIDANIQLNGGGTGVLINIRQNQ